MGERRGGRLGLQLIPSPPAGKTLGPEDGFWSVLRTGKVLCSGTSSAMNRNVWGAVSSHFCSLPQIGTTRQSGPRKTTNGTRLKKEQAAKSYQCTSHFPSKYFWEGSVFFGIFF